MAADELLQRLYERKRVAVEHMKAIQFDAEANGWNAEAEEAWKKVNDEIDETNQRYESLVLLEKREREMATQRGEFDGLMKPSAFANGESDEEKLRQFCRASLPDSDQWAPRSITFKLTDADKRAVDRERRDLTKLTAGAGGNLVPTGFVQRLYAALVEAATVRQFAGNLTTDSGENLLVPKTTTHGAGALVAEAGAIAESDAAFGQQTMNAYKYGQLIQLSTELVQDTAVDLLGYIAESGGRNVGLASGTHFVTGTGTAQPEGIMTNMTNGVTLAVGNSTGFGNAAGKDGLFDLYHSIATGYRARAVWVMNDSVLAKVRKAKDTTEQYLWQPGLTAGAPDLLLGRPVFTDPNLAAWTATQKIMAFGDFTQYYLVRDVDSVRFERSDDFAFQNDLITFRVLIRTDGKPIDLTAAKSMISSAT